MRTSTKGLAEVLQEADRTGDLKAAWNKFGEPTTLANARKAYKLYLTHACPRAHTRPSPRLSLPASAYGSPQEFPDHP